MKGDETSKFESLSLRQMQAINDRCNAFERAWKTGASPRLAEFLTDFIGEERIALAEQLVAIDLGYRRQLSTTVDTYRYGEKIPGIPPELLKQWLNDNLGPGEKAFPDRIGDYEILRKIGEGGMGVVYLARHLAMDRNVALKVIRPDLLQDDAAKSRFRREVKIAGKLH